MLELYWATNDPTAGAEWVNRFLTAAGEQIAPRDLARALRLRGGSYDMTGRTAASQQEYERAAEIFRSLGDEAEAVHLIQRIAGAALHEGDVERANRLASDALEYVRRGGHRRDEAMALQTLSRVAFAQGRRDDGIRLGYEAAAVAESVGFTWWRAVTLVTLAECLLAEGDADAAAEPLAAGLESLASVGDRVNMPIALAAVAALAARHAHGARAGLLWGAVEAAAENEPRATTTAALAEYEPHLKSIRGAAFDEARARGRLLSLEEAVAHALSPGPSLAAPAPAAEHPPAKPRLIAAKPLCARARSRDWPQGSDRAAVYWVSWTARIWPWTPGWYGVVCPEAGISRLTHCPFMVSLLPWPVALVT